MYRRVFNGSTMVTRKVKRKQKQKGGSVATLEKKEPVVVVSAPVDKEVIREKTRRALFQSL